MTEENFDIDPSTGLPELPEGFAWYVTRVEGTPVVNLCKVNHFWQRGNGSSAVGKYSRKELTGQERETFELVPSTNWLKKVFAVQEKKYFTEYEYIVYVYTADKLADAWTDAAILKAAIEIMDSWLSDQKREATMVRLSGPYPPNKLTPGEDYETLEITAL